METVGDLQKSHKKIKCLCPVYFEPESSNYTCIHVSSTSLYWMAVHYYNSLIFFRFFSIHEISFRSSVKMHMAGENWRGREVG